MGIAMRSASEGSPLVHEGDSMLVPMRLQRFLARAGVASRRGSEGLMTAGRVRVNGEVKTELGTKVDPRCDEVTVDGVPVVLGSGPAYIMLNKPAGFLTTMSDPHGRPTVAELVPDEEVARALPGRWFNMDTTGLLLFTTDGDLGQRLLHPSHHVWKTYRAIVDGRCFGWRPGALAARGLTLDDGPCQPARCRVLEPADARIPGFPGSLRGRRPSRSSSEKAERTRSSACSPRSVIPSSPCIAAGSANCGSGTWLKALGGNSPKKRSRRSNPRRGWIYRRIT